MPKPETLTSRARRPRREMTNAERKPWSALRGHRLAGLQFRRRVPCGPYIADFLCHSARLVVEVDGATHSTDLEIARDAKRDAWFAAHGFFVPRVTNNEVYMEFEGALETIRPRAAARLRAPTPALPRFAGEGVDSGS
jgi:very-short-patch-repair endonuclease